MYCVSLPHPYIFLLIFSPYVFFFGVLCRRDGVEALGTKLLLSREEEGFLLRLVQRKLAVDNKAKEMKADNGGQVSTSLPRSPL